MATKTFTAVAIAVGLVAVCAGSAGAGAGGGGIKGSGSELFQCYNINGSVKPGVVIENTNDELTNGANVAVPGAPQIMCVSASADNVSPSFNAFPQGTRFDAILCYAPQVSNTAASNITMTVSDPLTPGLSQTVRVSSTKYICVQAITSDCPGCLPPIPPLP